MKVQVDCYCGQPYEFEVEPVNGRMPCEINCPTCGVDGTEMSNAVIAKSSTPVAPAAPVAPASGLRMNRQEATPAPPPMAQPPPAGFTPAAAATRTEAVPATNSLPMGILGALLGAALGGGLMYGFFMLTEARFPLLGVGIGITTGYGARLLYKGRDSSLGGVAAVLSLGTVTGVLYAIYGELPMINIISMVVSVSMAWRIAS